jgi:hypothetical protein
MPTRLIDVSGGAIRLITTAHLNFDDAQEPPKYTALSYCWGLAPDAKLQFTTTASTKSERKRGIAFSKLSPVQQDAVTVTRNMSIQYLWIDSICIIQQDEEDWLKESARMGFIYSYASFTIVSLMPTNQSSFLLPSVPEVHIPFQSSFPTQSGITTPSPYIIRFSSAETHAASTQRLTKLSPHLAPNRWVTRGWTLQEQALSRRLFLFGPAGVRFICQSGSTTPITVAEKSPPRSILRTIQELQMGTASQTEGYEKWRDFARDFSGRSCTKQSDRLPALIGLATLLGKSMSVKDRYAEGLWRGDLARELLWRYMSPEPRYDSLDALLGYLRDLGTSIAPSWSWIDRFGITFFCYDDAVDDWGEWEEEFQLVNEGGGTFRQWYRPLQDSRRPALEISARILGSSELLRSAKVSPRGRLEERPLNDLTINIQGAWFHCMMDWSTATEDGLRDNIRYNLEHIHFVLIASARLNKGSSSRKAAIGLVLYPRDSLGESGEKTFIRIGAFYSVPDELGGSTQFTKIDIVKERISIV